MFCCQKHTNMLYSIGREKEKQDETKLLDYGVHLTYGGVNYVNVTESASRLE